MASLSYGYAAALGAAAILVVMGTGITPSQKRLPFDARLGPFYVAVSGANGARGSINDPWATIDGARLNIRRDGINVGMTQDVYVYVGAGFYPNTTTTFTDADSGSNGYTVHYAAQGAALTTRISGGTKIDTSTCVLYSGSIYKCPVGNAQFYTLYEDGKRPPHARKPNLVYDPHFPDAQWGQQFLTVTTGSSSRTVLGYSAADWDPTGWSVADIRIRGQSGGQSQWYEDTIQATAVNTTAHTVTLADDAKMYWFTSQGSRYFVECGLPCLDAVGEWYLDKTVSPRQLYIWPQTPIATTEIIYPTTQDVIRIVGASETARASRISFEGLTIEDSDFTSSWRWGAYCTTCAFTITAPDWDPTCGSGHTWPVYCYNETTAQNRHAMVWMQNTDHVTIKNSLLRDSGYSAMHAYLYNQSDTYDNNGVEHAGWDAFTFEGGYPAEGDRNNNNAVTNNNVQHVGELAANGSGVQLLGSSSNTISHNRFQFSRRGSIIILGGCTSSLASECYAKNNVISYNLGLDNMQDTADGGAFYVSNVQADGAASPFATNLLVQNVMRRMPAVPTVTFGGGIAYYFDPGGNNQEVRNSYAGATYTTVKDVGRTGMVYRNTTWSTYDETQMDFANIGAPKTNPYTAYFTEQWSDNFESGLGQWTTGIGTPALSTTQAHSATRSFVVNQDGDVIYKIFAGVHNQKAQVWFYDDVAQTTSENVACVYEDTMNGATPPTTTFTTWNAAFPTKKCLGIDTLNNSSFYMAIYVKGTALSSVVTTVPRSTGWHLLAWDYSGGPVVMYIDGYAVATYFGTAPDAALLGFNIMAMGDFSADARTGVGYFDDAQIY